MEPSPDWIEDCIRCYGKVLTGAKAHWCYDWDMLPIDETCPEFEACTCVLENTDGDKLGFSSTC